MADLNYVGQLQNYCVQNYLAIPKYQEGEKNNSSFEIKCEVKLEHQHLTATGIGRTKKDAKQNSANLILNIINNHT